MSKQIAYEPLQIATEVEAISVEPVDKKPSYGRKFAWLLLLSATLTSVVCGAIVYQKQQRHAHLRNTPDVDSSKDDSVDDEEMVMGDKSQESMMKDHPKEHDHHTNNPTKDHIYDSMKDPKLPTDKHRDWYNDRQDGGELALPTLDHHSHEKDGLIHGAANHPHDPDKFYSGIHGGGGKNGLRTPKPPKGEKGSKSSSSDSPKPAKKHGSGDDEKKDDYGN